MFGIRFIKVAPTDYVIQFRRGQRVREGAGLAFLYFAPTTSLVLIPVGSAEVPFIFEEVTADFQQVTVQGQLTYRVADPQRLAQAMNFALTPDGRNYATEDASKLPQRLINQVQVLTRVALQGLPLRQALGRTDGLVAALHEGLQQATVIAALGIEVLGLAILAIRPTPETARALEAEAREQVLRQADEAIYARRNAAVEQERAIKENELNTEIAVEHKKRQIAEAKLEAEKSIQQKRRELREAELATQIALEGRKQDLVALATANARQEAESRAYGVATLMQALGQTDPRLLEVLTLARMEPGQLVAAAFKDLAEGAERIGQLNVTPDLLRELMAPKSTE
jgi:hypothetical protein